ncbi:hypothetical protein LTR81_028026, partial [Elasticomyces elasticus]
MVARLSEQKLAEMLMWAVESGKMSDTMIIWLEGMGMQLSKEKLADLLEWAVHRYASPSIIWLEDKGAKLSKEKLEELLEEAVRRYDRPIITWLEDNGARLDRHKLSALLENMSVLCCRPNRVTFRWLEGFSTTDHTVDEDNLAEIFSKNTPQAQWLLHRGAQLKSRPTMLTVLYKQYND